MIQSCIDYLIEYRSWWLQQLQTEKESLVFAIETAIQEATNCLDQGVEPVSALAQAMWKLAPEERQVFSYVVSVPDLSVLCQTWVYYDNRLKSIYERFSSIPEEQPPHQFLLLAAICGNSMNEYDFHTTLVKN